MQFKLEFLLVANWDNTLAEWNSPTGAIAGISEHITYNVFVTITKRRVDLDGCC